MRNERGCERRRMNKERAVKQGDNTWKEKDQEAGKTEKDLLKNCRITN